MLDCYSVNEQARERPVWFFGLDGNVVEGCRICWDMLIQLVRVSPKLKNGRHKVHVLLNVRLVNMMSG